MAEQFEKSVNKKFVSELDNFLTELHQTLPLSASQQAEIDKHERIFKMRDTPTSVSAEPSAFGSIWDDFDDK